MMAVVRRVAAGALALLLSTLASAQASVASGALDHAAQRERIGRERLAIDETLQRAQAACYQRFAVEDCLRAARRRAREDLAVLRQQESVMDDRERRERAAQRLHGVEERQQGRGADVPPAAVPRASRTQEDSLRPQPQARPPDAGRPGPQERRQALQQRAALERQRQTEKQQSAQNRKARAQQRQDEDAARGRQPAAPLVP